MFFLILGSNIWYWKERSSLHFFYQQILTFYISYCIIIHYEIHVHGSCIWMVVSMEWSCAPRIDMYVASANIPLKCRFKRANWVMRAPYSWRMDCEFLQFNSQIHSLEVEKMLNIQNMIDNICISNTSHSIPSK